MVTKTVGISGEVANRVAEETRPVLHGLVAMTLQSKQLHWNVHGPSFRSVHLQLDEIVEDCRAWADMVAERMAAIGVYPTAQASDVANGSPIETIPGGAILDKDALSMEAERIAELAMVTRRAMNNVGEIDLACQDILIDITKGLEKHHWMLRSHLV